MFLDQECATPHTSIANKDIQGGLQSGLSLIGDILGVKGRVQTRVFETEDEKKRYTTEVVAEKVSFLSPNHKADA